MGLPGGPAALPAQISWILAAIQAPVIMMSQNRQETRDRKRSLHDYQVNLKAELEIQEVQMELINQITRHKP
ncbi:MAG: DUF1003 domain-containing protein [Burkholderiales bacterium]